MLFHCFHQTGSSHSCCGLLCRKAFVWVHWGFVQLPAPHSGRHGKHSSRQTMQAEIWMRFLHMQAHAQNFLCHGPRSQRALQVHDTNAVTQSSVAPLVLYHTVQQEDAVSGRGMVSQCAAGVIV